MGFFFIIMVRLDENAISFPDPAQYDGHEGIIAFGGDLSVERVWFAYQNGIFPGLIRERKSFGGVPTLDLYYFRRN